MARTRELQASAFLHPFLGSNQPSIHESRSPYGGGLSIFKRVNKVNLFTFERAQKICSEAHIFTRSPLGRFFDKEISK
jgi:hypothetical protein